MKDYKISLLADYYGEMLNERTLVAVRKYYDGDMSLSEIAELFGVTRQAIGEMLSKAAGTLADYEEKLRLVEKSVRCDSLLSQALAGIENGDADEAKASIKACRKLL